MFAIAISVALLQVSTSTSLRHNDDPIKERLDEAKANYEKAITEFRDEVIEWLDDEEKKAQKRGDLGLVERVLEARKQFEEVDRLPYEATRKLKSKLDTIEADLATAYREASEEYVKVGMYDEARALDNDRKKYLLSIRSRNVPRKASVLGGNWQTVDHELVQTTLAHGTGIVFGDPSWSDYDLTLEAMAVEGKEGVCAVFHFRDAKNKAYFHAGGWGNTRHEVVFVRDGVANRRLVAGRIDYNRWYDIRLEIRGDTCRCFLDGQEIFDGTNVGFSDGMVGLDSWSTAVRYRDIEITAPDGRVLWRGLPE